MAISKSQLALDTMTQWLRFVAITEKRSLVIARLLGISFKKLWSFLKKIVLLQILWGGRERNHSYLNELCLDKRKSDV